ncbi:HAMP domain-containing histidine kinase [Erysipelotrichaceae bacterium OttesenSCG-928-M19]|nr:HAMP domain-containing histidine kinase [Erysipelotrichaceae bacterium OttesenSCG-928-M19]
MVWLIIILLIITSLLSYKLISERRQLKEIKEQIELAVYKKTPFEIKAASSIKIQNELVEQINQLNHAWRETKADYNKSTQQTKEMIASITHDFRTPLTSMLGYVQILQGGVDTNKNTKYLKIIEERTRSLNKLVDNFYDISIIDSNEYPINWQSINPIVVLQNQLSMYYDSLSEHYNKVIIEIAEENVFINGDNNILNRVYSNLIKNALSHGQDTFKVETEVVANKLNIYFINALASIEVIDTQRLFERTYRTDVNRKANSTGLGLSIAKELIELISGNLEVEQVEKTLVFKLSLYIK